MRPAAVPPSAAAARVDRLIVHAGGDATTGARIAERLPGALEQAFAAARTTDERTLRRLVEQTVRSVAR